MRGIAVIVLALLMEAAVLLQLTLPDGLGAGGPAATEMARASPADPAGGARVPCRDGRKC